jgi:hypothetical protein
MVRLRKKNKPLASFAVSDETFARTLARIKAMTKAQGIQSLKDAGILTSRGNYTRPYRILASKSVR